MHAVNGARHRSYPAVFVTCLVVQLSLCEVIPGQRLVSLFLQFVHIGTNYSPFMLGVDTGCKLMIAISCMCVCTVFVCRVYAHTL